MKNRMLSCLISAVVFLGAMVSHAGWMSTAKGEANPTTYSYQRVQTNCDNQGQNIFGYAYLPEREGKLPLVIFAHELGNTHDSGTEYAQRLAELGLAAYTFDFRGGSAYSQSDGETTEMSVMTEADDLNAIIAEAKTWDFVDPEKIVVIGGSQGGMAAAVEAARHPEELAGLVLLYPALLIGDIIHAQYASLEDVPDTLSFLGWIRVGRNYATDVWDYDPYAEMKNYTKPVLLLHGDRDHTVDLSYSQRAAEAYPNATLHVIKGAGHGYYGESFEEAMTWIEDHLKELEIL